MYPAVGFAPTGTADASFPEGVYRVEFTEDGLLAAGLDAVSARNFQGVNTLTIEDGTFEWYSPAAYPPSCAGTYTVEDGRITLSIEPACGDAVGDVLIAGWDLTGDGLRFTDIRTGRGDDPWAETYWGNEPWTKID